MEHKKSGDLLEAIHSSAGMQHINRSHQRSFSLNIFRRNTEELIEISRQVADPDVGLGLMSQSNHEAGTQTHREVSRRLHNFVAAAFTLVDHTRAFMNEHYEGTDLIERYQAEVKERFAEDPISQFVTGLRNYMVHKGPPNSSMFMDFRGDEASPAGTGTMRTGIRFDAAELLTWDRWKARAREFLAGFGDNLEIPTFVEPYAQSVYRLHDWLNSQLNNHHSADLSEMRELQKRFAEQQHIHSAAPPAPVAEEREPPEPEFSFSAGRAAAIDAEGAALRSKMRKLEFKEQRRAGFVSERPVSATITDKDMLEPPRMWGNDANGDRVFAFARRADGMYGLDQRNYALIRPIVDQVLKSDWAAAALSREFVEEAVVLWLRDTAPNQNDVPLSEWLGAEARKAILATSLWLPIANLEVAQQFEFGSVRIAPITGAMLNKREAEAKAKRPEQAEAIGQYFENLREKIQGLAAVVVDMKAEKDKIEHTGEVIGLAAIGLLRFLSPGVHDLRVVCGVALLGREMSPSATTFIVDDDHFMQSSRVLPPVPMYWQISAAQAQSLKGAGLDRVADLIVPDGLSPFQRAIRSAILLYGTGATFHDPIDRLFYAIAAIETVLVKHSAEPSGYSVQERMPTAVAAMEMEAQDEVTRTVREAYRLRARRGAKLSPPELGSLAKFLELTYVALWTALQNAPRFQTVGDFIAALERSKSRAD